MRQYPQEKIGVETPRTYVSYTYIQNVIPDPVEYRMSLENSFDPETLKRFCRKMLQLLAKDSFPFKCKKVAVVGRADSGKTSWFAPFEAIIGTERVAFVVGEGKFSLQMINEETECVFMDEWDAG